MNKYTMGKVVLAALTIGFAMSAGAAPAQKETLDQAANVDPTLLAAHPELALMPNVKIANGADDLPHPLGEQLRERREQALQQKLQRAGSGSSIGSGGKVRKIAPGQYVELEREGEDLIWTIVAEFGNQDSWLFPGQLPGPQKNQIPQPDANNNTTIWRDDFNRDYYMDMLFSDAKNANSMRNYYKEQSSGRYAVDGDVTDWVQVPYNTAHYGYYSSTTWWFIEDALEAWYQAQLDAGKSVAEIDDYLSQFDVWDRYDYDGDGNFDEPDGYIDHFQAVHAGEGNEAGGGAYGDFAIWSHRWYAWFPDIGSTGPIPDGGAQNLAGGIQIGGSKYWIGDYTVEPENGGVGVFAHEFGHDHDLPDLYNTAGGPSNSTGWWTLMSGGSWASDGTVDIGSKPTHMGAWEKLQLGWLNVEVAFSGEKSSHKLGPAEYNSRNAQGLLVIAPPKEVLDVPFAYEGDHFYHSGSGANLANIMYKAVTLPAGATLNAQANLDIEEDWDYAYVLVSTDGVNWIPVATSLSTNANPNGQNFGNGITGSTDGNWVSLTADLSAFAGDVLIGFYYWTDGFVNPYGFMVDAIEISGQPFDGAEVVAGWSYDGFSVVEGGIYGYYFNAYLAEVRQYQGYDEALKTGPYVFGYQHDPALLNYVDHFPYQDGLLISYWDTSQENNNTVEHPGEGLILPIDAHPEALHLDPSVFGPNATWWSSIQSFDSTFGLQETDPITLHYFGFPTTHPSLPAVPEFNANNDYWFPSKPYAGVNPPKSDTIIRVKSGGPKSTFMQIEVE